MKVFDDKIIYVDIDETLLIPENGCFEPSIINKELVELLKEYKSKGWTIACWTSNPKGVEWVQEIVHRARIESIVDLALKKPFKIIDDDHLEYYDIIDPITFETRLKIK